MTKPSALRPNNALQPTPPPPMALRSRLAVQAVSRLSFGVRPHSGTIICGEDKGEAMTELVEASGEFEIEELQPFLERVSALVPYGFGEAEVASIVTLAQNMAVDDEKVVDFKIQYGGENTTLRLDVFMDDLDLPTVYFFAPPDLAALITTEMRSYLEAQEASEGE